MVQCITTSSSSLPWTRGSMCSRPPTLSRRAQTSSRPCRVTFSARLCTAVSFVVHSRGASQRSEAWSRLAGEVVMTLTQLFLDELDREAPRTRRALEQVPLDRDEWTPHPK